MDRVGRRTEGAGSASRGATGNRCDTSPSGAPVCQGRRLHRTSIFPNRSLTCSKRRWRSDIIGSFSRARQVLHFRYAL